MTIYKSENNSSYCEPNVDHNIICTRYQQYQSQKDALLKTNSLA